MLSCNIWFSAPSFWTGGGRESRCVGRVYGADGTVRLHDSYESGLFDSHSQGSYMEMILSNKDFVF